jgi:hypothetical protein
VNSIARTPVLPECSGTGRCENPIRVALAGRHFGAWSGRVQRRSIDTLRCQRVRRAIARTREACERRPGEVRVQGFRSWALEGRTPWEAPAIAGLKLCAVARHFRRA